MEELGRWRRDAPPAHFILKIQSFSTLSTSSLERYESPLFEAADAKWKLAIYPNGNKASGGQYHISLYLLLADKSCLHLRKEILVTFRLFIFDQINAKYLTVEGEKRFNEVKYEYGFDKFLPLGVFKDANSGYLLNGTCLFGAEVFLIQHTNKLKCLSMVEAKSDPLRYTWKINQFSNLEDKVYSSEKFTIRSYDWRLDLQPKGDLLGKGINISLYLTLINSGTILAEEKQVLVQFKLRIVDQLNKNHFEKEVTSSFGSLNFSWGWGEFLSFNELKNKLKGYLEDDSLIIEADLIVIGSSTDYV